MLQIFSASELSIMNTMFFKLKQSLAVWLIRKIQKYGPRRVDVMGNTYEVSEDVFNPRYYYTSRFMAENIMVRHGDTVLDMGTGSGIQAVTAAKKAARVVAVDINPEAVKYALKNIRANGVEDMVTVIKSDLFTNLDRCEKFSVILFTPPYLEGRPGGRLDHALFDPDKRLIERFFSEAGDYLEPDGYVQMLYSSIGGCEYALGIAEELGWKNRLTASEETLTERFFIYRLTRRE